MIYDASDDSFLMQQALDIILKNKKNKKIKILDMGSGSGILAMHCKEHGFSNILATDINPKSIIHLKSIGLNAVKTNLFSSLKKSKFDLIIFNPPYLPEDKKEPHDSRVATTGGKKGNEIILKFLKKAKSHLNKHGKILLLFSSLSNEKEILNFAKTTYRFNLVISKNLFFEYLMVYEFWVKQ